MALDLLVACGQARDLTCYNPLQSLPVGTEEDKPFGVWLRREMERRGYELEGPRAGGRTRLAKETGLNLSIISRILGENRVPEVKALRAIASVLAIPITDMLVHAGVLEPDDVTQIQAPSPALNTHVAIPYWVDLRDLPEWEQHIWRTPGLTIEQREAAILLIRLQRGDLHDDEGLLRLSNALHRVVTRRLEDRNPPRAM